MLTNHKRSVRILRLPAICLPVLVLRNSRISATEDPLFTITGNSEHMHTKNELRNKLKTITCFALDLDGTTYLGNSVFPFTHDFLQIVQKTGRKFLFVTNNSSKVPIDYVMKFKGFGLSVKAEQIYTSADATIEFLKPEITFRNYLFSAQSH